MDQIAVYLEKMGFKVEEQGGIVKFLTVMHDSVPIGFILPDMTVATVNTADPSQKDILAGVIRFVKENESLELVAGSEYLIATFHNNKLTTYYNAEKGAPQFAAYVVDADGEVTADLYDDAYTAIINFAISSQMLNAGDLKADARGSLRNRAIDKVVRFLNSKKAGQE